MKYILLLLLIFLIILITLLIAAFYKGKRTMENISLSFFGTRSLKQGMEQQLDVLSETPKSVSGMTKLCLPQIQRDFSNFNYPEMKTKAENMLIGMLACISGGELDGLEGADEELSSFIRMRIEDNSRRGMRQVYSAVRIHQTEISRYFEEKGLCKIILESAVEYYYRETAEDGRVLNDNGGRKVQTKYRTEMSCVQDVEKLDGSVSRVSIHCPNCGAPVRQTGNGYCEYCHSSLEELNARVWKVFRIEESI